MTYRHTQYGTVIILAITIGVFSLLASIGAAGVAQPIPIVLILLLGLGLIIFHALTVEIKDSRLECRLGPGLVKKTFMLSQIKEAQRVRIPWYAGWGIRWIPGKYLLWRVSGFQAVELALSDGSRFRIGTDEPDELVRAIHENKIRQN